MGERVWGAIQYVGYALAGLGLVLLTLVLMGLATVFVLLPLWVLDGLAALARPEGADDER